MTQKIFNQFLKDKSLKAFRLFDNDDTRQISCTVAGQKNRHSGQNKKRQTRQKNKHAGQKNDIGTKKKNGTRDKKRQKNTCFFHTLCLLSSCFFHFSPVDLCYPCCSQFLFRACLCCLFFFLFHFLPDLPSPDPPPDPLRRTPLRRTPLRRTPPPPDSLHRTSKISRFFFPPSDPLFVFFFSNFRGLSLNCGWSLRVCIIEKVVTTHIWALWTSCETPAAPFGPPSFGPPILGPRTGCFGPHVFQIWAPPLTPAFSPPSLVPSFLT